MNAFALGADGTGLRIGPPERLGEMPPTHWLVRVAADGTRWIRTGPNTVKALGRGTERALTLTDPAIPRGALVAATLDVSPDGRWVAAGFAKGGFRVFDATTGDLARVIDRPGSGPVSFGPAGELLTDEPDRVTVWAPGTWAERVAFRPVALTGAWAHPVVTSRISALSPDGRVAAYQHAEDELRLHDAASGELLARFRAPTRPLGAQRLWFSADGGRLFANTPGLNLRVWDLHAIRTRLAGMGLDWDHPAPPAAPPVPKVEFDAAGFPVG